MTFMRVVTLLTIILLAGLWAGNADDLLGKKAPAFSLPTVGGKATMALKDFQGKVVLLDFWASWCGPCKKSLPALSEMQDQFRGLRIVGISIDDKEKNAQRMMKDLSLDMTALFDGKKSVAAAYEVSGMPTAVLIDQKGVVQKVYAGYTHDRIGEMKADIGKLLK
ncbi:MAG TPA: TlpA disulfide reductase family protein [Calditrichia bacterium]|nr:TlpA family protein disulfide reductase [Calditrichota bacterium]HQU73464.1 TlpA disulfide reductase family protein [Calditrichia bacterium]HQV32267.1 TlpA disulfide reductase family protein [Calditrichia bacterium]